MLFDYKCPQCGFVSLSHESEERRDLRGSQHELEHETGEPMPEIGEFMKEQNQ